MNYFNYCASKPCNSEPAIALAFWCVGKHEMHSYIQEKFPHLDKAIAEIYYDALEEQMHHDIGGNKHA